MNLLLWRARDLLFRGGALREFEEAYSERTEARNGSMRLVIREMAHKYLGRGDLKRGAALVRCRERGHECLRAYSCKRRYSCTSRRNKRAVVFAEWQHSTVHLPLATAKSR